jgi:hypothetical protein
MEEKNQGAPVRESEASDTACGAVASAARGPDTLEEAAAPWQEGVGRFPEVIGRFPEASG